MAVPHPLDEDLFPPFRGFPPEGIRFLERLKRNNNRPWFQKHKAEYEELVRFPMQCLVASLAPRMADIAPEMDFNPRKSVFRIYRDVRFSKNKAPYKTNIAASFQIRGRKSLSELPGLYIGIEPGPIYIGGGLYMPGGDQLKAIRHAMVDRPDDYRAIVESKRFRREFGEVEGEMLQKAPLGFPADHPMIGHLKHKQFYAGKELRHTACFRASFLDVVVKVYEDIMPFVRWLDRAVR